MFNTNRHERRNEEKVTNVHLAFILSVPPALLHANKGEYAVKPFVINASRRRLPWNWLLDLNSAITLSELSWV
jgi:hypothetical protein